MKASLVCNLICTLLLNLEFARAQVGTNDVIAPASASGAIGNSSQIPLDTGGPERFQQVYGSSLFGGFPQGVLIHEILFRGDENVGHPFATTISDIEIHFSTTSKAVDSLSPVFDSNVGADDAIVVDRNALRLVGDGGGGVLHAWNVDFYFPSKSFFYNPSAGNLLLDIKVFTGASTCPFDAVDSSGDAVSSVFGVGLSIPSSGQTSSLGLASDIYFNPVPEPSTAALLVFGAIVMALAGRKRLQ